MAEEDPHRVRPGLAAQHEPDVGARQASAGRDHPLEGEVGMRRPDPRVDRRRRHAARGRHPVQEVDRPAAALVAVHRFRDGRQLFGLGDYEGRSWQGWHRHATLVMPAHFFVVRETLRLKKSTPA